MGDRQAGDWVHPRASETSRGGASPWSRTPPARPTSSGEERIPCTSSSAIAVRSGRCKPHMSLTLSKVGTLRWPRQWRGTPIWWRDTLSRLGWGSAMRSKWCAPCLPGLERGLRRGLRSTRRYITEMGGWSRGGQWWGWWWGESWCDQRRPGSLDPSGRPRPSWSAHAEARQWQQNF